MTKISLIVPFYNESVILSRTAKELSGYCRRNFPSYEIIFVDDGSSDGSGDIIRNLIRVNKNISLHTMPDNLGRGAAVRNGMLRARGDIVAYCDADLEIGPRYIRDAVSGIGEYDAVIASKFAPGSEVTAPAIRKISSYIFNLVTRLILGTIVSDHQAGMKVFKKQVIFRILPLTRENGWFWDTEVLYFTGKMGYRIREIPIKLTYGYRLIRSSFIVDFIKLPIVLFGLKRNMDKRLPAEFL